MQDEREVVCNIVKTKSKHVASDAEYQRRMEPSGTRQRYMMSLLTRWNYCQYSEEEQDNNNSGLEGT
jgi:hypothetical protein